MCTAPTLTRTPHTGKQGGGPAAHHHLHQPVLNNMHRLHQPVINNMHRLHQPVLIIIDKAQSVLFYNWLL
jgi:hypothetical protein